MQYKYKNHRECYEQLLGNWGNGKFSRITKTTETDLRKNRKIWKKNLLTSKNNELVLKLPIKKAQVQMASLINFTKYFFKRINTNYLETPPPKEHFPAHFISPILPGYQNQTWEKENWRSISKKTKINIIWLYTTNPQKHISKFYSIMYKNIILYDQVEFIPMQV